MTSRDHFRRLGRDPEFPEEEEAKIFAASRAQMVTDMEVITEGVEKLLEAMTGVRQAESLTYDPVREYARVASVLTKPEIGWEYHDLAAIASVLLQREVDRRLQ